MRFPPYFAENNRFTAVATAGNVALTYAPQVNPSPLTASYPGQQPLAASLVVVVTNTTGAAVSVLSIGFSIAVGDSPVSDPPWTIPPLTADVTGVGCSIYSPNNDWTITNTSGNVTGQMVLFSAAPPDSNKSLQNGQAIAIELYNIPVTDQPCVSTVVVNETLNDSAGITTFQIPVLNTGFYLEWLMAVDGSSLPVSQVGFGQSVTLHWNCSETDLGSYTILQSTALGQKVSVPVTFGSWTSPPLYQDTSFILRVQSSPEAGAPYASLSVRVAVENASLFPSGLEVQQPLALTQLLFAEQGLNVKQMNGVTGNPVSSVTANVIFVSWLPAPPSITIDGTIQSELKIRGGLTSDGPTEFTGLQCCSGVTIFGQAQTLSPGVLYTAHTDGILQLQPMLDMSNMGLFLNRLFVTTAQGSMTIYASDTAMSALESFYYPMNTFPIAANSQFVLLVLVQTESGPTPATDLDNGQLIFFPFGVNVQALSATSAKDVEWSRRVLEGFGQK